MKKLFVLLFVAVLIFSSGVRDGAEETRAEKISAAEVEQLARQFAQRLQETREFGPVVQTFFAERFIECHLRAELGGKENGIFSQISASMPGDIAAQTRDDELRRYVIARLNFFHLRTLHRMSTRDLKASGMIHSIAPNRNIRRASMRY